MTASHAILGNSTVAAIRASSIVCARPVVEGQNRALLDQQLRLGPTRTFSCTISDVNY